MIPRVASRKAKKSGSGRQLSKCRLYCMTYNSTDSNNESWTYGTDCSIFIWTVHHSGSGEHPTCISVYTSWFPHIFGNVFDFHHTPYSDKVFNTVCHHSVTMAGCVWKGGDLWQGSPFLWSCMDVVHVHYIGYILIIRARTVIVYLRCGVQNPHLASSFVPFQCYKLKTRTTSNVAWTSWCFC